MHKKKINPAIVEEAIKLAALGWKIVPLQGVKLDKSCTCSKGADCPSVGKHPTVKAWQNEASDDESVIQDWADRGLLKNLGVKLGPDSGIIDIECDSPEAEQALGELFGDEMPVTPTFKSGRGNHRIFKWSDDLPPLARAKAKLDFRGIEIRTGGGSKGAQSVFPPSVHVKNGARAWLPDLSPDDVNPAEIPPSVLAILAAASVEGDAEPSKPSIANGVAEGGRNNAAARWLGLAFGSAADVDDQWKLKPVWVEFQKWNRENRPPLPKDELKTVWASILNAERKKRAAENEDMPPDEDSREVKLALLRERLQLPTLSNVILWTGAEFCFILVLECGKQISLGDGRKIQSIMHVRSTLINEMQTIIPMNKKEWPIVYEAIVSVAERREGAERWPLMEWLADFAEEYDCGDSLKGGTIVPVGSQEWWEDLLRDARRFGCFTCPDGWFHFPMENLHLWLLNHRWERISRIELTNALKRAGVEDTRIEKRVEGKRIQKRLWRCQVPGHTQPSEVKTGSKPMGGWTYPRGVAGGSRGTTTEKTPF